MFNTSKSSELKRGSVELKIYEMIQSENLQGRVVDNEYAKKHLNALVVNNLKLNEILKSLCKDKHVLSIKYVDDTFYVCLERLSIEAVINGWVHDEEKKMTMAISSLKDDIQKQRLKFKQNILKSIAKSLREQLERLKSNPKALDVKEDTKASILPALKDQISKHTQRFLNSYRTMDLYTFEALKSSHLIESDVNHVGLIKCIESLVGSGEIEEIAISEADSKVDKFYIDTKMMNTSVLKTLEYKVKSSKSLADQKMKRANSDKRKLLEYNEYVKLNAIYESLNKPLNKPLDKPLTTQRGDKRDKQIVLEHMDSKKGSLGKQPKVGSSTLKHKNDPVYEDKKINDRVNLAFLQTLNEDQLIEEIKTSLNFNSSSDLLETYYKSMKDSKTPFEMESHYKTFFVCLGMLIKIPDTHNHRLYEIAKLLNSKVNIENKSLVKHMSEMIDEQFGHYSRTLEHQNLFNRFDAFEN